MSCPHCNQFIAPGEDRCRHCGATIGAAGEGEKAADRAPGELTEASGGNEGQEPGAYFTGTGVRGQAPDDHHPWPGKRGFWSSPFQQSVTWFVGHLWWVIGGVAVLLAFLPGDQQPAFTGVR